LKDGGSEPRATPLPFSLSFVDGQGRLSLQGIRISGVTIERLELEIKGLTFPFDLTSGPNRLRDRWLEAVTLELSLAPEAFRNVFDGVVPEMSPISDLKLDLDRDTVELIGRFGSQGKVHWFVLRAVPDIDGASLILRPDLFLFFGPPLISMPQLTASLCQLQVPPLQATEGFELRIDDIPRSVLRELLPAAGYRIPDCRRLKLSEISLSRRQGAKLTFERDTLAARAPSTRALALAEVEALLRPGDEAARRGELGQARACYASALADEPGHSTIVERIAWLDVVSPTRREAARVGCERTLEKQDSPGLHAILGSLLIAEGNHQRAEEHFRRAGEDLGPLGRARLLCVLGRLQLESDPLTATALLESAMTLDPTLVEALEGLRDGYAALGQRGPLQSVAARLATASDDPDVRCRVLICLGRLWHHRFGDSYRATDCYEQALLERPDDQHALLGLAECHAAKGEYQASLRCLDATAKSAAEHDDSDTEVAAHLRAGELWEELGDSTTAAARYRRAARIAPDSLEAVEKAANADWQLARYGKAAAAFGRLASLAADAADREAWRRALESLSAIQLEHLQGPGTALAAIDRYLALYDDDDSILALREQVRRHGEALELAPVIAHFARKTSPPSRGASEPHPLVGASPAAASKAASAPDLPSFDPFEALDEPPEEPLKPPARWASHPSARPVNEDTASDLSSALVRAADSETSGPYRIPLPAADPPDDDVDQLIQAHLRVPDDEELAAQLLDRLESTEDWARLVAVLSGMVEHLEGKETKRQKQIGLLNHLAEVLIEGLEDLESGAECFLRIATLVRPADGAAHAQRAASLLRQGGFAAQAAEAETIARQLAKSPER
jgi:tetratricopeptide (TPR) repeat protein